MDHTPIDEVRRLHVFIETWLSGGDADDEGWHDFEAALGEGFTIVSPAGEAVGRSELLAGFRAARGAMPGVTIEIRNAFILREADGLAVVRYEEWQLHPTMNNQRKSTATFVAAAEAPLGWSWFTLHETAFAEANP